MKASVNVTLGLVLAAVLATPTFAQDIAVVDEPVAAESAAASLLELPARLTLHEASLTTALTALYEQSGVRVAFSPSLLPQKEVSCQCAEATVRDALDWILAGTDFRYSAVGQQVLVEPAPAPLRPQELTRVMLARLGDDSAQQSPTFGYRSNSSTAGGARAFVDGVITGSVTHAGTGRPLSGVQVFVEGTSLGSLTDAEGQYRIASVPEGDVTVRAQMIGYGARDQTVTVAAGESVAVNFELRESAIGLDEVVVTGTPGGTQRRALGTSLSTVDAVELMDRSPITSFDQLLQGRDAGVLSVGASGTVGSVGQLQLRGITSITQGSRPLIYVDGVRLEDSRGMVTSGEATSRLADLNLQDIERVEIIKGAAASTLYGSEASAGVIQIFTRRGQSAEPQYSVSLRTGLNHLGDVFPLMHPDPQYPSANDILRTGLYQEHSASVRGQTDIVNYYASGSYLANEGVVPNNDQQRISGRVNLGIAPSEALSLDFTTNFIRSELSTMVLDNVTTGLLGNIMMGNPVVAGTESDPYGGAFMPIHHALTQVRDQSTFRFIGGVTAAHRIGDVLSQSLTVGLDFGDREQILEWPYSDELDWPRSSRSTARERNLRTNLDYAATWVADFSPSISSELSVGGQLALRDMALVSATGQDFAAPGLSLIDGTAVRDVGETTLSYTTGGIFIQEQLGFDNILFITAGLRVDGSSVFGEDFGFQAYPKLSGSYVISDAPWFRAPWVSSLRFRAGYGLAGMQPGAFDAQRTYAPFNHVHGQAGIRQATLGNPDLSPEITREFEGGFDGGFLNDRLTAQATVYRQRTTDLLVDRSFPASGGFTTNQVTNVGEIQNQGAEITLGGAAVQRRGLELRLTAAYAYNDSRVVDLEDVEELNLDRFGTRLVEGHAIPSKWGRVIVGTDPDGTPIASDEDVYLGDAIPPHNGSFRADLDMGALQIFSNLQWAAGHVVTYEGRRFMIQRRTGAEYWQTVIDAGGNENDPAVQNLLATAQCCIGEFTESGDWMKLREVGLSYQIPDRIFGGAEGRRSARLNLSARNLFTLTGYSGTDPEIAAQFGDDSTGLRVSSEFFSLPQPRQFVVGLNVDF